MRIATLLLAGLAYATPVWAQEEAREPAPAGWESERPAQKGLAPAPGDPVRRLCASWQPDAPAPLLETSFRAPSLRYQDGALLLELSQAAVVEDGPRGLVELLPAAPYEALAPIAILDGARLVRAQAAGQLEAHIAFYPERGPLLPTPCFSLGGGRVLRMRMQPLWVSLWQGGKEQARLYTERGEGVDPGGRPSAEFDLRRLVFDGESADLETLRAALRPLQARAAACYQNALERRADLAGLVILGADVDRDGRPGGARVEVDATGEPMLGRCLRDVLAGARFGRLRRGGHLSVTLNLRHGR